MVYLMKGKHGYSFVPENCNDKYDFTKHVMCCLKLECVIPETGEDGWVAY